MLGLIDHSNSLIGQDGIFINEFQASNFSTIADSDFSAYSDWIELYNSTDAAINIGGYYLTDDLLSSVNWQIPSNTYVPGNGYLIFWCDNEDVVLDEFHTNFRLNSGGETIGLFNEALILLDSITYFDQVKDVSLGRNPDDNLIWNYFPEPTPGSSNSTTGFLTNEQANDPSFSIASGFFTSPQDIYITAAGVNAEIRYTSDGSQPDQDSELFTGNLSISSTVVIRAKTFSDDVLPSKTISHSYFIDEPTTLPVISLIMNPEFLSDPETGIYVDEDIDLRRDWERNGTIEYYNVDHELDFTINADFRLFGNSAIYYPQKSLAVFPDNPLEYQLFDAVDTDSFYSLVLRSSSDDWPHTMLRDALMHTLVKDHLKLDHQAYTPSVFFINGEYFGIHNIREKFNERYLETYHNIDPQNVDIIHMDIRDTTIIAIEGDLNEIEATLEFIQENDLSEEANYNEVKNMIDVENYVDYLVGNLFFSNTSWHHNVKVWREKTSGAKWKWLLYDLDRGMFQYYVNNYSVIEDLDTTDLFFPHLNENIEFQSLLLNRLTIFMSTVFESQRVEHHIDSLKNKIAGEITDHSLRWKDECDYQGNCGIQSYADWITDVDGLYNYTEFAQGKVIEYMNSFYSLEGLTDLNISIENPDLGDIYINGIKYQEDGPTLSFFKGIPIDLKAVPKEGSLFLGWEGVSYHDTLQIILQEETSISARFGSYCFLPQIIDEDYVATNDCDAYYSQGSITVLENANFTIQPDVHVYMTYGDSIKVYGNLIVGGDPDSPSVIRSVDENSFWGGIHAMDATVKCWYTEFLNCKKAVSIDGGEIDILGSTVHFSPYYYSDIFSIHSATTKLVGNLIYGPDDDGKTDVIDCDDVPYANIEKNVIIGTTDDGIDIGTGSSEVYILENEIYNCNSMGISVGEYTTAYLDRNIISGCGAGIQVHSEATAHIDNNTVYNNDVAIRCFHYPDELNSGGHAIVKNTILSSSQITAYELYENSTISFDYSLCDTESLAGEENIYADPMLIDPDNHNFNLQENSPCIDTGDPSFNPDPDGSRIDIGAKYYDHNTAILEINKNNNLVIYPNPAINYIKCYLRDTSETIQRADVYDQQGKRVYSFEKVNEDVLYIKDIFGWSGLYYITIITVDNKKYTSKFIVINNAKR